MTLELNARSFAVSSAGGVVEDRAMGGDDAPAVVAQHVLVGADPESRGSLRRLEGRELPESRILLVVVELPGHLGRAADLERSHTRRGRGRDTGRLRGRLARPDADGRPVGPEFLDVAVHRVAVLVRNDAIQGVARLPRARVHAIAWRRRAHGGCRLRGKPLLAPPGHWFTRPEGGEPGDPRDQDDGGSGGGGNERAPGAAGGFPQVLHEVRAQARARAAGSSGRSGGGVRSLMAFSWA